MNRKRGFTLIELLVVIAIIAILAVLVMVTLSGMRVKARNSTAKSDVTEAGKSVEVFKDNETASERVIGNENGAGVDTLDSLGAGSVTTIFTGITDPVALTYGLRLNTTPGTAYIYSYYTSPESPVGRDLVEARDLANGQCYVFYSNLQQDAADDFFFIRNGSSGSIPTGGTAPDCANPAP